LGSVLEALYLLGRWDEIQARANAALDAEPEQWSMINVWMPRCRVALARGNLIAAAADLAAMTTVPGATGDAHYGADLAALEAALAAARGDLQSASARAGEALEIAASSDDVAGHLGIAALAIRIKADALDAAQLTGHRASPAATRGRAEHILATAHESMTRTASAGGCHSLVLALLETLARAELSRIPGPADPGLWHQVAASELAGPYLAGYARLQQAASLLARRRREATAALRDAEAAGRPLAAAPLRAQIATLARRARIDLAEPGPAPPPAPDPAGLTPREREVITLLSDGLSNAEIAKTSTSAKRPPACTCPTSCANLASPAVSKPPPQPTASPPEEQQISLRPADAAVGIHMEMADLPDAHRCCSLECMSEDGGRSATECSIWPARRESLYKLAATQIGGYLRTGRGRTPVTGRDPFSGLVYADLADSVRPGPGPASFGVVWSRAGQRPRRDNRTRPALAGRRGSDGAASWCVLLERKDRGVGA